MEEQYIDHKKIEKKAAPWAATIQWIGLIWILILTINFWTHWMSYWLWMPAITLYILGMLGGTTGLMTLTRQRTKTIITTDHDNHTGMTKRVTKRSITISEKNN